MKIKAPRCLFLAMCASWGTTLSTSGHKWPRGEPYGDSPSPQTITQGSTRGFNRGSNGVRPNPGLAILGHVVDSPGIGQDQLELIAGHSLFFVADETPRCPLLFKPTC